MLVKHTKLLLSYYGLEYEGPPRMLPDKISEFRIKLLKEELDEYIEAKTKEDKFDALIDLVVVALGSSELHGFPFNDGWIRVLQANLNKVRRPSERGEWDIVKPAGWTPPNLSDLVKPINKPVEEVIERAKLKGE